MTSPAEISAALTRAGSERLSPAAKAYLAARLARGIDVDRPNLGAMRDLGYGARSGIGDAGPRLAVFPNIGAAASALVAASCRAAPRAWGETTDGELASLGAYPIRRAKTPAIAAVEELGANLDKLDSAVRGLAADIGASKPDGNPWVYWRQTPNGQVVLAENVLDTNRQDSIFRAKFSDEPNVFVYRTNGTDAVTVVNRGVQEEGFRMVPPAEFEGVGAADSWTYYRDHSESQDVIADGIRDTKNQDSLLRAKFSEDIKAGVPIYIFRTKGVPPNRRMAVVINTTDYADTNRPDGEEFIGAVVGASGTWTYRRAYPPPSDEEATIEEGVSDPKNHDSIWRAKLSEDAKAGCVYVYRVRDNDPTYHEVVVIDSCKRGLSEGVGDGEPIAERDRWAYYQVLDDGAHWINGFDVALVRDKGVSLKSADSRIRAKFSDEPPNSVLVYRTITDGISAGNPVVVMDNYEPGKRPEMARRLGLEGADPFSAMRDRYGLSSDSAKAIDALAAELAGTPAIGDASAVIQHASGWRLFLYALLGTWVIGATAAGIAQIVKAVHKPGPIAPDMHAKIRKTMADATGKMSPEDQKLYDEMMASGKPGPVAGIVEIGAQPGVDITVDPAQLLSAVQNALSVPMAQSAQAQPAPIPADLTNTFRALMADWEGFDRIGVGTRVLPNERRAAQDWRTFSDGWLRGSIDPGNLQAGLNEMAANADRIRKQLQTQQVVDPALVNETIAKGSKAAQGVLSQSAAAGKGRIPILDWLSNPDAKADSAASKALRGPLIVVGGVGALLFVIWTVMSRGKGRKAG